MKLFIVATESNEDVIFSDGMMLIPAESSMALEIRDQTNVEKAMRLFPSEVLQEREVNA